MSIVIYIEVWKHAQLLGDCITIIFFLNFSVSIWDTDLMIPGIQNLNLLLHQDTTYFKPCESKLFVPNFMKTFI